MLEQYQYEDGIKVYFYIPNDEISQEILEFVY